MSISENSPSATASQTPIVEPSSSYLPPLLAYFRSGWAFLIPYLAVYLLYAWLKWPVNPSGSISAGIEQEILNGGPVVGSQWSAVPCLLHVYWCLHALHLVLGAIAFCSWWQESGGATTGTTDRLQSTAYRLLPWLCLALIFWIPGVYLEWPSDPWEHLRRINEWRAVDLVTTHSSWVKSSYFIPYSLLTWATGLRQIYWLDYYYTSICLLLCWQYYRLGRACNLDGRASTVFVILQALFLGNNIFSLYRYYGISSSVYGQLGAVALIRTALEIAKGPRQSLHNLLNFIPANSVATTTVYRMLFPVLCLLSLIAFNHPQGIGIAALGITAVLVWRLIEWKRATAAWLVLAAIGLSVATILWFPQIPSFAETYRSQGWLTTWYGFNLFQPSSPAFDRTAAILGAAGLLNLFAGFWILRRNHIVAWLTIVPVIALSLPFVAIPYLRQLIDANQPVAVFHRMLLAVPTGLALVTLGTSIMSRDRRTWRSNSAISSDPAPAIPRLTRASQTLGDNKSSPTISVALNSLTERSPIPYATRCLIIFGVGGLILVPASNPSWNRLYNTLMRPPADLSMRHVLVATETLSAKSTNVGTTAVFIATTGISFVANSDGIKNVLTPTTRSTFALPWDKTIQSKNYLVSSVRDQIPALFLLQAANTLYTPQSLTAHLSQHWHSYEVAFEYSSGPEAERIARALGYRKIEIDHVTYYLYQPN